MGFSMFGFGIFFCPKKCPLPSRCKSHKNTIKINRIFLRGHHLFGIQLLRNLTLEHWHSQTQPQHMLGTQVQDSQHTKFNKKNE